MPEVAHPDLTRLKWLGHALSPYGDKDWVCRNISRDEQDWRFLIGVGSRHFVLPALHRALVAEKMETEPPDDAREALEGVYLLNRERNRALRAQMLELSHLLNGLGVAPVWLKGATTLLNEDWAASARMMVDLDFWIEDERAYDNILATFDLDGYQTCEGDTGENHLEHHHFAPRYKKGRPASVEFHKSPCELKFQDLLDGARAIDRVEWIAWEGTEIGQLCAVDRLMNSYLQCISFHADVNRPDDRRLTAVAHFSKTLDFLERFAASQTSTKDEFFQRLRAGRRMSDARKFFSILKLYFGLEAGLDVDASFLKSIVFATRHPKFVYARYMAGHAWKTVIDGRLGPPGAWWTKIYRHARNFHER
ncbi:MAG: hypothetical protein EKK29_18365 [Hyphomicrobiales bacterium]|nr:MAG: hypothetical protein EKK29_18365 [Hyphomicrobiales bacterium]